MRGQLTDSDWERIAEFADTPKYERTPDQLVPNDHEE
jgi:hypothetical protein